jgi:hypothetical protein
LVLILTFPLLRPRLRRLTFDRLLFSCLCE